MDIDQSRVESPSTLRSHFVFTRSSYFLLSGFLALIGLIAYVWSPLLFAYLETYDPTLPFWVQFDWLLLGIFLVMTLLIMINADIKKDLPITIIGLAGGLVIESWGTQTLLWTYYTNERPPLWIIPAWAIASLSIDRLYQLLEKLSSRIPERVFKTIYWVTFVIFYGLMLYFVRFTFDKSLTIIALIFCAFLIMTPPRHRQIILVFIAGSGLGFFLELWGTTRQCWVYYTMETPPLFAIFAHGMAAVSFWRVLHIYKRITNGRWLNESQLNPANRPE
ncbi:MAG: hypothetical protein LWX83_13865 [Anaerolineae bacterium]|nr:hypothetical protein [Anaerolineae bacterium]